jgi:hypothetical protein
MLCRAGLLLAMAWPMLSAAGQSAQTTFDFHSGFWVNLHHTLYNQAAGKRVGRDPNLAGLSPTEIAAWNEALDYYDQNLTDHDLLELSMIRINGALAAAADAASLSASDIPKPLLETLAEAAPIYRAHWWTEQDRKNREWIDRVSPMIASHEKALKPALSHAYNTPWPDGRIRVEMSYYTTGAAAYTSLRPTIITISSWSQRNEGSAALETIFHEAGHSLVRKITDEMSAAEKRTGRKLAHQDLWHALMFYTTGELVKQQAPDLIPYAVKYGMWEHDWPGSLPVLEKDWKPFLDGKARFKDALDRIVADSD